MSNYEGVLRIYPSQLLLDNSKRKAKAYSAIRTKKRIYGVRGLDRDNCVGAFCLHERFTVYPILSLNEIAR